MKSSFGNFWRLTVIFVVLLGSLLLSQNALGAAPTAPINLRLSLPPTAQSITLAWDPPASSGGFAIAGYKIERAGQTTPPTNPPTFDAFSTPLVANTGTATTSFANTGLSAGQLFKYKVSAINSNAETGPASSEFIMGTQFSSNQQFTGTQTFQPGQAFGDGTMFATNQEFTGTQTFGANQQFGAGTKFAANQDFTTGKQKFGANQQFGAGTMFATRQEFTGTQTFGANQQFGAETVFPAGQAFTAAQTFGNFPAFDKNTDFSALIQTFPTGAQFDAGTKFKQNQQLVAGTVPSYGILLNTVTCGADAACPAPSASDYLAPGKIVGSGTNPAAVKHAMTSTNTFSIAGLGVGLSYGSAVTGATEATFDILEPSTLGLSAPTTRLFGSSTGTLSFPVGASNFQNVGSVMEVSLDGTFTGGTMQVSLPYDNTGMTTAQEANLKLLHKIGSTWTAESNCSVDTVNKKVTCTISTLSPFTVGSDGSSATTSGGDTGRFVPPSFTGSVYGQNEYPLTIAGKSFTLPNFYNPIATNVIQAGQPTPIKLLIYSSDGPSAIKHVALFTNLSGVSRDVQDSDTFISYDANQPLQIVDPHGLFANATVNVTPNNNKLEVDFTITFAKPMPKSDIIIRSWDTYRASSDVHVANAIEVLGNPAIGSALTTTPKSPTNNMTLTTTNSSNITSSVSTVNQTNSQAPAKPDLMSAVKDWGGYSANPISDSQLLQDIGLKGNHVPSWVLKTTKWVVDGEVSEQEFVNMLKYLEDSNLTR